MTELLDEIHPGEILLEELMKPLGLTTRQLASDMDVSTSRIRAIVRGHRSITADTALRLGLFFTMDPRFWLNLQTDFDLRRMERDLKAKIAPKIRVHQTA
ncbi:MAG: HigA family addiction module antitoxin [Betaproteobacteria bacterium]